MPILKTSHYDVIIVGAGINGCACSYFLSQAGLRVALIDQEGIAAGGSGAAGAFISPKISKAGLLKEIMAEAHGEALSFYTTRFPEYTLTKPLLHIAHSLEEGEKLDYFKKNSFLKQCNIESTFESTLSEEAKDGPSVCFQEGAVVDAKGVCQALAEGSDFFQLKVERLVHKKGQWRVGDLEGDHIILSIGAYPKFLPIDYVGLRGIWGHRIDITTTTPIPMIMHHYVSISPTTAKSIVAIGATHNVHYSPFSGEHYDIEEGRKELIDKALKTLKLDNINIVSDYTGLRSGSNDYLPILGMLVDAEATLKKYPHLHHGQHVDPSEFIYYPHLTMINGSGGYGFVLAPYLAKRLKEWLIDKKPLNPALSPSRFFPRWAKRRKHNYS